MLNILCRHSFCDFVKIVQKFLPLPMLEITTKSTYFLPAKKKIPILCIELQTNKNVKGFKTLHLSPNGKKFANYKDFFQKCESRSNIIFQKIVIFFFTVVFCLLTCTNQCTKNKVFRQEFL